MSAGSRSFTDTAINRDSLEPAPPKTDPAKLIHRDVCGNTSGGEAFSASRGHPVYPVALPSHTLSFSVGELAPSGKTSNHRHAYESMVYVLEGSGHTLLEAHRIDWQAGDAFYVPPWCWHQHHASEAGRVRYLTATNLPLLHKLGQTVLRQEEPSGG